MRYDSSLEITVKPCYLQLHRADKKLLRYLRFQDIEVKIHKENLTSNSLWHIHHGIQDTDVQLYCTVLAALDRFDWGSVHRCENLSTQCVLHSQRLLLNTSTVETSFHLWMKFKSTSFTQIFVAVNQSVYTLEVYIDVLENITLLKCISYRQFILKIYSIKDHELTMNDHYWSSLSD